MDRNKNFWLQAGRQIVLSLTRRPPRAAKSALAAADDGGLIRRFRHNEAGSYVIIAGLAMPALIGFVGLGVEVTLWLNKQQTQQSAADSAALSAAAAYYASQSVNITQQANAVTSSYGLVNGAGGVTVTTNRPPHSGNYTANSTAIEVTVQQTQQRLFSSIWDSTPLTISARAVALANVAGNGCVMALNSHAGKSIVVTGTANVTLNGCSLVDNSDAATALEVTGGGIVTAESVKSVGGISGASSIKTTNGISTGVSPTADPYKDVAMPTPPTPSCVNQPKAGVPQPNTFYCGLDFNSKTPVTLSPGTYFIGAQGLQVNAQASISGTDVTLVFTQSGGSYGQATINGGATVNLTAPTTGPTAGIVMFGDRNMPVGTDYKFNGGATQVFTGAIYLPKAHVSFDGGANSPNACLQLIGDTLTFNGNSNFAIACGGKGTRPITSGTVAKLVE